jgi:hemolysin activation/secretion protein
MSKPNSSPGNFFVITPGRLGLLMLICFWVPLAAQILPPPPQPDPNRLAAATRLVVREFQFEGNQVFTAAELTQVTSSYTNREISTADLEQARRAVSLHYVSHGYINSGAVIPDQDPTNGIVRIRIVEGRLTGINLSENNWLSDRYIKSRVARWSKAPLNMNELREGLQLLRQNPNVTQVNAELKPGAVPGESQLDLRLADQQPFCVGLQVDNQRPPSVGSEEIWALASDQNLTGHSDPLELRYGLAHRGEDHLEFSEFDNVEASYRVPFTRYDTTLGIHGSRLNTALVEDLFVPLDISSLTTSYGVELRQPIHQTANQQAALTLGFDHRRNKTWLLDAPFSLSPGSINGEMKVSSLRFSQEWLQRGPNYVVALRSTFNFGLDVLDSTDDGISSNPDGTYFSWQGQAQYVQRLFKTQNQLVLRVSGQWTDDRLLALEQFSVGGFDTVRGYLENQLVRDRGVVASAEFRVPVLFNKAGAGIVSLAPFFDFGGAWNVGGSSDPTTISSLGMGLLVTPNKHISAQLYWGYRLRDIVKPDNAGAQGAGISFRINIEAF